MATFDAASAVEPMDWNFEKYGAGKGTVPEPSDIEIERFMRKYRVLSSEVLRSAEISANKELQEMVDRRLKENDPDDPTEVLTVQESIEVMRQIDFAGDEKAPEIAEAMLDLVVTITKGSPNKQQLLALPNRVRGAFYGWLIGQLTNPDFSAAAGMRPSLSLVNGG